jgi:hypothetical protein
MRGDVLLVCLFTVALTVSPVAGAGALVGGSHATAGTAGASPHAGVGQQENPCTGTVTDHPDSTTLFTIQGARGSNKTTTMLVSVAPDGTVGVYDVSADNRRWAYDVEPLANGNLLLSTTRPGVSYVDEVDPYSGERVGAVRFGDVFDSHDADLINGDEIVINDMSQEGDDGLVVYNLTRREVVWEYRFANHTDDFPKTGGGEYGGDWTHNNDVDVVDDGVFMVSVRNFDQVVAINRSTKEIEWRLGEDDNHSILNEQHNPDYIHSEDGNDAVLVADSQHDRVVEYERTDDGWNRTWVLEGGVLNDPRDADRLPNGNTLIADRYGDRIIEVTPEGDIVWEFYAPWQPYDAERVGTGDGSTEPTMKAAGHAGVHQLNGTSRPDKAAREDCYTYLLDVERTQLLPDDEQVAPAVGSDSAGDGGDGTDSDAGGLDSTTDADGSSDAGGTDGSTDDRPGSTDADTDSGSDGGAGSSGDGESGEGSLLGTPTPDGLDGSDGDDGNGLSGGLPTAVGALVAVLAVGGVLVWLRRSDGDGA